MKYNIIHALAATALFIAAPSVASAADMPLKAPPPAPAPVYSWTGFYIGGNVGGAWGHSNQNSIFSCPGILGSCTYSIPADLAAVTTAASGSVQAHGFTGGGQAGYNRQTGAWVYGIETDLDAFHLTGSLAAAAHFPAAVSSFAVGTSLDTDWLFTARARLGVLVAPAVLLYATGGVAVTELKLANTFADNFAPQTLGASSNNVTKAGWTVGGGAEWMFVPQWSIKAEYLYVDFGSVSTTLATNIAFGVFANSMSTSADLKAQIARVGLNYKIGGP
jgi:outer membrane immunogenic protein